MKHDIRSIFNQGSVVDFRNLNYYKNDNRYQQQAPPNTARKIHTPRPPSNKLPETRISKNIKRDNKPKAAPWKHKPNVNISELAQWYKVAPATPEAVCFPSLSPTRKDVAPNRRERLKRTYKERRSTGHHLPVQIPSPQTEDANLPHHVDIWQNTESNQFSCPASIRNTTGMNTVCDRSMTSSKAQSVSTGVVSFRSTPVALRSHAFHVAPPPPPNVATQKFNAKSHEKTIKPSRYGYHPRSHSPTFKLLDNARKKLDCLLDNHSDAETGYIPKMCVLKRTLKSDSSGFAQPVYHQNQNGCLSGGINSDNVFNSPDMFLPNQDLGQNDYSYNYQEGSGISTTFSYPNFNKKHIYVVLPRENKMEVQSILSVTPEGCVTPPCDKTKLPSISSHLCVNNN